MADHFKRVPPGGTFYSRSVTSGDTREERGPGRPNAGIVHEFQKRWRFRSNQHGDAFRKHSGAKNKTIESRRSLGRNSNSTTHRPAPTPRLNYTARGWEQSVRYANKRFNYSSLPGVALFDSLKLPPITRGQCVPVDATRTRVFAGNTALREIFA